MFSPSKSDVDGAGLVLLSVASSSTTVRLFATMVAASLAADRRLEPIAVALVALARRFHWSSWYETSQWRIVSDRGLECSDAEHKT